MWYFCVCRVRTNRSQIQRRSTHRNVLALKFLVLFHNLKLVFITIVMVWLRRTHSYCCRFTKTWSGALQWYPSVGLHIMEEVVMRSLLSSNALMFENPRSINCGVWFWTTPDAKFVLQRKYRSSLELLESLWPITLLKMDAESRSLRTFCQW